MANYTNINSDKAALKNLTKFYGYYDNAYKDPFIGGNAFIFVTKPLLFIEPIKPVSTDNKAMTAYLNMCKDPIFNQYIITEQLNEQDRKIVESLSYNTSYSSSSYLPIFTNECKNFDAGDITMEQTDVFDTKQGFRQPLPTYKTASESANSLSISVTEDSNLDFTKMMTLWVNYISNITDGTFDANPEMILNGTLDYTCSIYYFVLDPDGKTLKYWAKYTGCWPTAIPYGALKYSKGQNDATELDIQFAYSSKEDMNPRILEDFNITSLKLMYTGLPTYDEGGFYSSIKNSPLLNREMMLNLTETSSASSILNSPEHDPVVLYRSASKNSLNPDDKAARFELYFDDTAYKSDLIDDIVGKGYYINDEATNAYAKTGNSVKWDVSDFWNE